MNARWWGRAGAFHPVHLVRRFCGSLWPGGPRACEVRWVTEVLSPAEHALWARLSGPDRRHSVAVARRAAVADRLEPSGMDSPTLLGAALLHDLGKLEAGLGTVARVGATLAGLTLGRSRLARYSDRRSMLGRVGRYLCHDRLGGDLLRSVGSHPLVVTWAEQHHLPPARWDLPPGVGAILKAADDD